MAISEAHKRANQKWDKENMMTLGVRLKKKDALAFKEYAAQQGRTANAILKDFVFSILYPENEAEREQSAVQEKENETDTQQ